MTRLICTAFSFTIHLLIFRVIGRGEEARGHGRDRFEALGGVGEWIEHNCPMGVGFMARVEDYLKILEINWV